MSPAVVAGSSYLPSELPVNDNPWCTALPCLSYVYQLSLRRVSRIHPPYSDRVLCRVFSSAAISRDFVRPAGKTAAEMSVTFECRYAFFGTGRLVSFVHI